MAVRDLLERFRPAGTPGAAAPTGVPVDWDRRRGEELLPVLALLAETEQDCEELRRSGRDRAERMRSDAASRASTTRAAAREQADAARAEAAARQRRINEARAAEDLKDAHRSAAAVGAVAKERIPAVVTEVLAALRSGLLPDAGASADGPGDGS